MEEAEFPQDHYETTGLLFVRKLKKGIRPLGTSNFVSPVDGTLVKSGNFDKDFTEFEQIKGKNYSLQKIIGGEWKESDFREGGYSTIYLAPHNYHRIHSPMNGQIEKCVYIPGALWPVNTWSVGQIDGLFHVNERLIMEITNGDAKVLAVMIGATNVGCISSPQLEGFKSNQPGSRHLKTWDVDVPVEKGAEIGCFNMGSTVVLIWNKSLEIDIQGAVKKPIKMGEDLRP